MLDVFSLIFVADTKIIFRCDFVAPLISIIDFTKHLRRYISKGIYKYQDAM